MSCALMVIGYFELPQDEQPPENIWHDPARLEEWFEAVDQRRKNPGMTRIEDDDNEPMLSNESTKSLRGG